VKKSNVLGFGFALLGVALVALIFQSKESSIGEPINSEAQPIEKLLPPNSPAEPSNNSPNEIEVIDGFEISWGTKTLDESWCNSGELTDESFEIYQTLLEEYQKTLGNFTKVKITDNPYSVDIVKDYEQYYSYSKDTLRSLGKNGDLRALTVFFERAMNTENDSELVWSAVKSLVYGGTFIPSALSIELIRKSSQKAAASNNTIDNEGALIDAMAWSYLAAMHGDLLAWDSGNSVLSGTSLNSFDNGILDQADIVAIQRRAAILKANIDAEKRRLNLDTKPKDIPKVAAALNEMLVAEHLANETSVLWPAELQPNGNCFEQALSLGKHYSNR
tara:strand:- start:221 stop:1216 length:996 start_codon:yes stop_codon:yes gene_type:complete